MSNQSHTETESFLTEESVVPENQLIENLKNQLKNELESYKREITGKIRFLQAELSDAKFEIAGLKTKNENLEKRVDELKNQTETQELKIEHLEKTIDEKIIENEMQRMTIENNKRTLQVSEPPRSAQSRNQKPASEMVATNNFGLNDDELKIISNYGCLGRFLDNDKANGKKWIDEYCFALLLKAIDHGMTEFTLKMKRGGLKIGSSKLVYLQRSARRQDGDWKTICQFLLRHKGRKMRFKARCQVMDSYEGFDAKCYSFIQTDANRLYEHSFLWSEIPVEKFYCRFHFTLLE